MALRMILLSKNVCEASDPKDNVGLSGPKLFFCLDTTLCIPNAYSEWFHFSELWMMNFFTELFIFPGPSFLT